MQATLSAVDHRKVKTHENRKKLRRRGGSTGGERDEEIVREKH